MQNIALTISFFLCAVALPASQADDAAHTFVQPSANVAAGAKYTLDPAPDYSYCTEPGDATQLTDGVYTQGYFWTQLSTVGWTNVKPIIVTLDLGSVKPIRGLSYNTAAGVAGVTWPTAIHVFTADTEKQFHWAGELVALSRRKASAPVDGYATHRFWTDELHTHGRYISLVIFSQPFAFVDEIEVYEGDPAWTSTPMQGDSISDMKAYAAGFAVRDAVERRLSLDLDAIRKAANAAPDSVRQESVKELDLVANGIADLPLSYGNDFKAVLPLNPLHERLFRVQAHLWQAKGLSTLTIWQSGLWEPLALNADPPKDAAPKVDVRMMRNEFRAASFNVSNGTQKPIELSMHFDGIPGGAIPPYVTVHEVAWTDTTSGQPVASALPLADKKDSSYLVHVPSGMTRQVWLTFHPVDLLPKEYEGQIRLVTSDTTTSVPLMLKIYPISFPDKPRLHFGGWDYTDQDSMYQVTPQNRAALIANLREHFVDSPWATAAVLSVGEYNGDGKLTKPPDTAHFDTWLDRWPGAAQYCVFAAVSNHLGQLQMGTPQFDVAVKAWSEFWAEHIKSKGLKPEQFAVLLVDEPAAPEQDVIIAAWAKPLRASATGIRIWEDPTYHDAKITTSEMVPLCDVLCPNRVVFLTAQQDYRDFFAGRLHGGTTLEFYSCSGPARLLDPYSYYRLQAWTCWQCGATASYFWAFGDGGGGSSWNEYSLRGSAYTPLFLDATTVTDGKELEACREGIEDYEYLAMLRDAIATGEKNGLVPEKLALARTLLGSVTAQVCDPINKSPKFEWRVPLDRTVADSARIQILDALAPLWQETYKTAK